MSQKLIQFINDIYDGYPHPIYLAKLGEILKSNGFSITGLRATIESIDGFTVVQGKEKERTAIAKECDKEEIQKKLNNASFGIDKSILNFLQSLPKNVLFAFCSKRRTNGSFFIERNHPFHYFATREKEDLLEIPANILIDTRIPADLRHLAQDVASQLASNIKTWAASNAIDFSQLATKHPTRDIGVNGSSLLKKVIQAIPANQRHRVSLPLDIIDHLLK